MSADKIQEGVSTQTKWEPTETEKWDLPTKSHSEHLEHLATVWHDSAMWNEAQAIAAEPDSPTLLTNKGNAGKKAKTKKEEPTQKQSMTDAKQTMVCTMEVKDFDVWHSQFVQHAHSKTGSWGLELPFTRSELCDDEQTLVLRSTKNPNRLMLVMVDPQVHLMGPLMVDENFKKVVELIGEKEETKVMKATVDPPGTDDGKVNMAGWLRVEDFDVWIKGFWEHSTSKLVAGVELPAARGEFLNESRTEIFRGVPDGKYGDPNQVGMTLFEVDNEGLGPCMADKNFIKVIEMLGVIKDTQVMKVLVDPPEPPKSDVPIPRSMREYLHDGDH